MFIPTKPLKLSEADLQRQIEQYLALDEWHCRHFELNFSERKARAFGERGMPDLMCIRYHPQPHWSHILWIECKTPAGRYSVDQRAWAQRERRWGATVLHMGVDFEASLESFAEWYEKSGLQRRQVKLQNRRTA